jgi:hypothetical protein
MAGLFESGKVTKDCDCGKRGAFVPQAMGDATINPHPGDVTGGVPLTRYTAFGSQALEEAAEDRVTVKYPAGKVTGAVPMDPKEMLVYHDVL